jgi:AraC-like DNA-binding protein
LITAQPDITITPLPGVNVISARIQQQHESQFPATKTGPILDMYFSLQGHSSALNTIDGATCKIGSNHHGIVYTPSFDGHYTIKGVHTDSFCVEMEADYLSRLMATDIECLKRFWGKVALQQSVEISSIPLEITLPQKQVIMDMRRCRYTGHMRDLYLESKIVELFLLQVEQADKLAGNKGSSLSTPDQERLYAARDFVKGHLFEPITLLQVARHCGLNDFKLKKGFKELFGTTVFGYLNELKMEYGRQLLLESSCTVYEVAYTLGYNDPYNFSKAFKKYFGYMPGKLKK